MQPIAMADAGWLAWQVVRSRVPVVELLRTKGTPCIMKQKRKGRLELCNGRR